jgi:hypothetical protein
MSNTPPELTQISAVPPEAFPKNETVPPFAVVMVAPPAEVVPLKASVPEFKIAIFPAPELFWNKSCPPLFTRVWANPELLVTPAPVRLKLLPSMEMEKDEEPLKRRVFKDTDELKVTLVVEEVAKVAEAEPWGTAPKSQLVLVFQSAEPGVKSQVWEWPTDTTKRVANRVKTKLLTLALG